jgi:hypothetical protein
LLRGVGSQGEVTTPLDAKRLAKCWLTNLPPLSETTEMSLRLVAFSTGVTKLEKMVKVLDFFFMVKMKQYLEKPSMILRK